ncbi:Outer membrane lipoprotein slyB Flags: Precursor [Stenotrophomonas maltophilia RA8]|uniref:outer membrane lipoprotein n=1 Tax=Stenotrophomonas maltophilia TaxID=40324 RepID=UPI0002C5402D|nr:hypothetical protein [Stenotrophomonas maltophilia]MCD5965577.1 hypothetical protein [Stenotrophomonas maltophilia]QGL75288.1 hypothetical protein FEO95_06455 [Stenotrophomonas maltophilia]CCP15445.1 Outer membrane lipoprotein slyB Flags: Precursor [Stenotrophomonas maltophilia RA8]
MRTSLISIAIAAMMVAGTVHAGSTTSASHFGRDQALVSRNVQEGVVVMVRDVRIDNRSTVNTGTVIGGALGAAMGDRAASKRKHRDSRNVARVVGATSGALAGGAIQRAASNRNGIEIFVRTTDGRGRSEVVSIIQDADSRIHPGQRVFLSGKGRDVRVVALDEARYTGR